MVLYFGSQHFGVNSAYVSIIGLFVTALLIVSWRKDLLRDACITGIFMAALTFVIYQIWLLFYPTIFNDFWHLQNISGITIWSVPVEELLFLFVWGAFIGPVYELLAGLKIRRFAKSHVRPSLLSIRRRRVF